MTLADATLAVLWLGRTAYVLFGGADFGGGFGDLLAGGSRRGARQRELVEHSIGPVRETNHVWLIFVIVILWTGFPSVFAAVASTLYIPLTLVALWIIARDSAFGPGLAGPALAARLRHRAAHRVAGGGGAALRLGLWPIPRAAPRRHRPGCGGHRRRAGCDACRAGGRGAAPRTLAVVAVPDLPAIGPEPGDLADEVTPRELTRRVGATYAAAVPPVGLAR